MSVLRSLLLVLVVAVVALAQPTGPPGIDMRTTSGVPGTRALAIVAPTTEFTLDTGTPGEVGMSHASDVSRFGDAVGDVPGEIAECPAIPPVHDCEPGMYCVDPSGALTGDARRERLYSCIATDTWAKVGSAVLTGIPGGTTLHGGTGDTDALVLNPSTSTTPSGELARVRLCANAPTYDANNEGCFSILKSGATFGTGVYNLFLAGLGGSSTVFTQSGSFLGNVHGYSVRYAHQVAAAVGTGFVAGDRPFWVQLSLDNQDASTPAIVGNAQAFNGSYSCAASGAGGSITVPRVERMFVGTVGSACTVTDWFVGGDAALNLGTVDGSVPRLWGWHATAATIGTARFQFGASETTPTGSLPANEVAWGAESGSPGRFYVQNENQNIYRLGGQGTWTGQSNSALCTAAACTDFFPVDGDGYNATEASVTPRRLAPGALRVYGMSCGLSAATGASRTRTFTLMVNGSASASIACTTAANGQGCSVWNNTGQAVTVGQPMTVRNAVDAGGSATAATGVCTLWYNVDAF